jgi:hypothetical protein
VSTESYCLDVRLGCEEQHREELIEFLKENRDQFGVTKAQCGVWEGRKLLRIQTPKGGELARALIEGLSKGDENVYEVHDTVADATHSLHWLPDLDTVHGHEEFNIASLH